MRKPMSLPVHCQCQCRSGPLVAAIAIPVLSLWLSCKCIHRMLSSSIHPSISFHCKQKIWHVTLLVLSCIYVSSAFRSPCPLVVPHHIAIACSIIISWLLLLLPVCMQASHHTIDQAMTCPCVVFLPCYSLPGYYYSLLLERHPIASANTNKGALLRKIFRIFSIFYIWIF